MPKILIPNINLFPVTAFTDRKINFDEQNNVYSH